MKKHIDQLLNPDHLYTASEVSQRPCPVPVRPGVYAWYFDAPLPFIDMSGCAQIGNRTLLYVGISPKPPNSNGRPPSKSNLRQRIRTHYFGNAAGSTLRRTLGCLLGSRLGIELRVVGGGGRYTFTNPGEQKLDQWMHQHAFVTWVAAEAPWKIEKELLFSGPPLPLNVGGNASAKAAAILSELRLKARLLADKLPVIANSGGPRRSVSKTNE